MSDFPSFEAYDLDGGGAVYSAATTLFPLNSTAPASTAWPSANLAIFVPIRVSRRMIAYKMAIGAGATAAGNFDVGIYDVGGNRLVSSGATAKGASAEQIINITDTQIGPGLYYLALSANGTNNYMMVTPSGTSPVPLQKARLYGTLEAATSYTLPATATMVARTGALIPMVAVYLRDY